VSDIVAPAVVAPAAPAAAESTVMPPPPATGTFIGVGRRKTAVARVRLTAGSGKIMINGREMEKYFNEPQERRDVLNPLDATNSTKLLNVTVRVVGGGHSGQAGAVLLGISRALVKAEVRYEPVLRDRGYLTRDSREVERKKYGRRKARRRFQFSKR
jgi:small subunit ribosomal protein S9